LATPAKPGAHRLRRHRVSQKLGIKTVKFNPQFSPILMATFRDAPDPIATAQDNLFYKAS
jgi:hypothetical protein